MNRRHFLASLISVPAFTRRHPSDHALQSIQLKEAVPVPISHGDTWAPAWAEDGNLYSPSNDTHGMYMAANSNVAFNQLSGADPVPSTGITVDDMGDYGHEGQKGPDGCTWKSSGCLYIDGALYLVVARHKYGEQSGDPFRRQTAANASIIRSTDLGRTWTRSAEQNMEQPQFPGRHFATPYFIQYGLRTVTADNADRFIYAVSNDGFWDNGDQMILGRVPRARLAALQGADWEYYTGGDGMHRSAWTANAAEAKPILQSQGFLRVLDERTLGFADLRGNKQYITMGNLQREDRVALFLMDYPGQRRLKILGRAKIHEGDAQAQKLIEELRVPEESSPAERALLIHVEAFDWNCPQHIAPRYTKEELAEILDPMRRRLETLEAENKRLRSSSSNA